eukprot:COSAG02_NODE_22891_length_736_cov_1.788069_2_plen_119_part_00
MAPSHTRPRLRTTAKHPPTQPAAASSPEDCAGATAPSTDDAIVCVALLAAAMCALGLMLAHPPDARDAAVSKPFTTFSEVRDHIDEMCCASCLAVVSRTELLLDVRYALTRGETCVCS